MLTANDPMGHSSGQALKGACMPIQDVTRGAAVIDPEILQIDIDDEGVTLFVLERKNKRFGIVE